MPDGYPFFLEYSVSLTLFMQVQDDVQLLLSICPRPYHIPVSCVPLVAGYTINCQPSVHIAREMYRTDSVLALKKHGIYRKWPIC